MQGKRILVLGGTREARDLTELLVKQGAEPVTSLAGLTREPVQSLGAVRKGGFGGTAGLIAYIEREGFDAVADATHPFAAQISTHAAEAALRCGIALVRLERPPWDAGPEDRWYAFPSCEASAAALHGDERVLLTVGSRGLAPFLSRPDLTGVVRVIDTPGIPFPEGWKVICGRPPFSLAAELALIEHENITVLIAKNSGGLETRAKLDAARQRSIPVHLIERPRKPDVPTAATPEALVARLAALLRA